VDADEASLRDREVAAKRLLYREVRGHPTVQGLRHPAHLVPEEAAFDLDAT